jgi:hypothetical protein
VIAGQIHPHHLGWESQSPSAPICISAKDDAVDGRSAEMAAIPPQRGEWDQIDSLLTFAADENMIRTS